VDGSTQPPLSDDHQPQLFGNIDKNNKDIPSSLDTRKSSSGARVEARTWLPRKDANFQPAREWPEKVDCKRSDLVSTPRSLLILDAVRLCPSHTEGLLLYIRTYINDTSFPEPSREVCPTMKKS
jgi:hypothetical protein